MATPDRDEAFATLYHVLIELTKIAAPFVPFISEAIYRNLRKRRNALIRAFVRFSNSPILK